MTWISRHALEVLLISGYLVFLVHHAIVGHRHVRSLDDYLVAGRRLGGTVIGLSFYATFMSTNTFIGAAGKSWDYGIVWCVGGLVLTGLACLSWLVVAPRFVPLTKEYASLTVADFLGAHYRSTGVRKLAAVVVAFSSVLYLVAIYRGAALALSHFLELGYVWSVATVFVIVTAYTLLGGFESVVLTDALQGILMLLGAVAILVGLIVAGHGPGQLITGLRTLRNGGAFAEGAFAAAMAYSLAVGVKYLVEPRQLSRFYGLRDGRALRTAALIAPVCIGLTYLCLLPVGALARVILDPQAVTSTDEVVPFLLGPSELLGPLVGTMFLLVLVSAALSSIDSVLLVAASTIDRDLRSELADAATAEAVGRTRLVVVLVSGAAALTAILPWTRDIVEITKFSGSLYGACFLPVLVVGLFVRSRHSRAAVGTIVVGGVTVITVFSLRKLGMTDIQEVYPGILVGMAVFFVLNGRSHSDSTRRDPGGSL